MGRTMSFYDLRDAMALPGCPVCRLKENTVRRHLDNLLWESVNDAGVRREIRNARGFCQQHAWQLVEGGSSLGVVIIMHDVMQHVLQLLETAAFQPPAPTLRQRARSALDPSRAAPANAELLAKLRPQAPCPVCVHAETTERVLISTLVQELLGEGGLLSPFRASEGLCLSHLRQALAQTPNAEVFDALVGVQREIWRRLTDQLAELIRKEDYRFRHEARGEEKGASLRALAILSGPRIITSDAG